MTDNNRFKDSCIIISIFLYFILDEVRIGAYSDLYHPDNLINEVRDTGGLYTRGYYVYGRGTCLIALDRIQKLVN